MRAETLMMIHLPPEIIAGEILPRLPVKSLLKFRCVSKSWCSLISYNQHFIKSHLNNSTSNILVSLWNRLDSGFWNSFRQCPLSSDFDADDFAFINKKFILSQQNDLIYFVGSYNGLCCVEVHGKGIYLWNPATKNAHKLPDIDNFVIVNGRPISISRPRALGFMFDEVNNDYKVLSKTNLDGESVYKSRMVVHLYSLRTNCWEEVETNVMDRIIFNVYGKFLSGKLHWRAHVYHEGSSVPNVVIYSFDVERKVFGLVEQPNYREDLYLLKSVGVLDRCLSCTLYSCSENYLQVWVMKHYGINETWHLLANFSRNIFSDNINARCEPFYMSQEGEIWFSGPNRFIMIYNPKTKQCRNVDFFNVGYLRAHVYVESLVSPVPVGDLERPQDVDLS